MKILQSLSSLGLKVNESQSPKLWNKLELQLIRLLQEWPSSVEKTAFKPPPSFLFLRILNSLSDHEVDLRNASGNSKELRRYLVLTLAYPKIALHSEQMQGMLLLLQNICDITLEELQTTFREEDYGDLAHQLRRASARVYYDNMDSSGSFDF